MKRFFTVVLLTVCFIYGTAQRTTAQSQSVGTHTPSQVLHTMAPAEAQAVSKPKAPETPVLMQIEQQTGVFTTNQKANVAEPIKGDPTDKQALAVLAERFRQDHLAAQLTLQKRAQSIPVPRQESANMVIEYKKVMGNAAPLFYVTSNLQGAETISTNKLWPGGLLGLNLAGQGVNMGEWDGGAVRITHQEFGGRVSMIDNAPTLSSHATHVAATMMGAGTDPQAKGMAYQGV